MSGIINLIFLIVIVGVVLGLINNYIPMPGVIKSILNIVVVLLLVVYILQFFELIQPVLPTIRFFR